LIAGIDAALDAGDAHRLASEAHALKGISQTIGADELARVSHALEDAGRSAGLAEAAGMAPALHLAWDSVNLVLESHSRKFVSPAVS
jgi:HPt (histidine-containing phosphotransfer) domain-containing protein